MGKLTRHFLKTSRTSKGTAVASSPDIIVFWSGLLSAIPANWALCDGTAATPNFIGRFLKGAPASTNPGATGGLDSHGHDSMTSAGAHAHSLSSQSHSHTVSSSGGHKHNAATFNAASGSRSETSNALKGAHTHTTDSQAHTHSMDSQGGHVHTIAVADGRPPFTELAPIQAAAGASFANNIIIIWTGTLASIPTNWALCNGAGGTPDARGYFPRGVNTPTTDPGTTGGATTHLHTEGSAGSHTHTSVSVGSHSHTFSAYTWTHDHHATSFGSTLSTIYPDQTDTGAGNHTHANSNTASGHTHNPLGSAGSHAHTVNTASSLPVYRDVAFIFKTGGAAAIPTGGVVVYTGTLASIPAGYIICDGTAGTTDMRDYFIRGAAAGVNPGGTGGANTHTHTEVTTGAHSGHSQTSAGTHQHTATDTTGDHSHSTILDTYDDGSSFAVQAIPQGNGGAHSHTYSSENAHTHTQTSVGDHTHTYSTDDGTPYWYEVAFIQKT